MRNIELPLRDGFAVDRACNCLAHAIAIVTGDWRNAQIMAKQELDAALEAAADRGLTGATLALAAIAALDASRDALPV